MTTKTSQIAGLTPAERLDRRIQELNEEIDRFRAEHGDPAEAMRTFMQQNFDRAAMEQTVREYRRSKGLDLDDEGDEACTCPDD